MLLCTPNNSFFMHIACELNPYRLLVGISVPHIITDVVLLGFPVPLIWKLQMLRRQKVVLTVIFTMGSLYVALYYIRSQRLPFDPKMDMSKCANEYSKISVTMVSIIRLVYLSRGYEEFGADSVDGSVWTNIEANVSIICGQYMIAFSAPSPSRDNVV